MTVQELIVELQHCNPAATVKVCGCRACDAIHPLLNTQNEETEGVVYIHTSEDYE